MKPVSNHGSDSQQGACTASRTGGTYIETGGTVTSTATATVPPPPPRKRQIATVNTGTASRSSVQLTWKDNSNNETRFVIERCDQILRDVRSAKMTVTCRRAWNTVDSTAANTTIYVTDTMTANQTHIHRVKATIPPGSSAYTPGAVITAPVK